MATTRDFKRALITGAASGIGRAFVKRLAGEGAALGLIDVAADTLEEARQFAEKARVQVSARVADVADREALTTAVSSIAEQLGGLDLIVHCAAILGPGRFLEQPAEDFERVLSIDLLGTANVVRAGAPIVRSSQGAIVCIASTAAVHGWPEMSAYSTSKFGVAGFCDSVGAELARDGVLLTAVFPLLIATPLLEGADRAPILKQGKAIPPEAVVNKTMAAVRRGKRRVYVPGSVRLIAAVQAIAPSLLDWYGARFGMRAGTGC